MSELFLSSGGLAALALALSALIDRFLGEPPNALHPVCWIGNAIAALTPKRRYGSAVELLLGGLLALGLPTLLAGLTAWAMARLAPYPAAAFAVHVFVLSSMFSLDGLRRAGARMVAALRNGLAEGRSTLSWLCSRDPSALSESELVAATVESVSENASDSFVAPVLFYVAFGLPGAVFYRVVNTLDAMIGYRGRFEYFGKAAARLDDLCNLVPARLTALMLLGAGVVCDADVRGGMRVLTRDRARTESPNAGWPMAAMAGLLGLQLSKPGHYTLGDGVVPQDSTVIGRATRLVSAAGYLLLLAVIPFLMVMQHG